ncbi:MAG TPA: hypothetical protein VKN99_08705 [Polyangia bacterium]|nr:hypothetical protein [Polyangia bacterium]
MMATQWREVMAVARPVERPLGLCRGGAAERLAPTREESRLWRAEMAARGFPQEAVVAVEDWQILEEISLDAGFDVAEVAWFLVAESELPTEPAPPPLGARVRSWLRSLVAQAQPALPGG